MFMTVNGTGTAIPLGRDTPATDTCCQDEVMWGQVQQNSYYYLPHNFSLSQCGITCTFCMFCRLCRPVMPICCRPAMFCRLMLDGRPVRLVMLTFGGGVGTPPWSKVPMGWTDGVVVVTVNPTGNSPEKSRNHI